MAKTTVYRVQPVGKELGSHRTTTSNDNADKGVHVFGSLEQLYYGVNGWCNQGFRPEVVEIECDERDVQDNGDYEGFVLVGNRGTIVSRTSFKSWKALASKALDYVRGE